MHTLPESVSLQFNSGEKPIENAPQILLKNGRTCIPQHFLTYQHDRQSIEAVLSDIDYDPRYLLFVSEDGGVPYIQVGIVGYDNYKSKKQQPGQKIVFGRRWRVEPNLPTSEVIQTCFLAIKKAREHEIRELLSVSWDNHKATPFNSHHDLPLLARNRDLIETPPTKTRSLGDLISSIRYDRKRLALLDIEQRMSGQWIIDIAFGNKPEDAVTLIVSDLKEDTVLHALIEAMIAKSDRHVDETFKFQGFARFSHQNSLAAISDISVETRGQKSAPDCANMVFDTNLAQEKYDTDSSRVPQLTQSSYSRKLRQRLESLDIKTGFKPI